MRKCLTGLKRQGGASSIVEYSIILPICMFVLVFIFMVGYYLNQQALLDAAVNRGVLIAQKVYSDPNSSEVMLYGEQEGDSFVGFKKQSSVFSGKQLKSDPYRFFDKEYRETEIQSLIKNKVINIIRNGELAVVGNRVNEPKVYVTDITGTISRKMTVTASQEMHIPVISILIGKENSAKMFTITSTASVNINHPTEFVRNAEFVSDTLERFGAEKLISKITGMFDKVKSFIDKFVNG